MKAHKAVHFDQVVSQIEETLRSMAGELVGIQPLWIVRDLQGRVRVVIRDLPDEGSKAASTLRQLIDRFVKVLGAYVYPPEQAVLATDHLATVVANAQGKRRLKVRGLDIYLLDQQVTCRSWATASAEGIEDDTPKRVVLYSIKSGVGRTTTAAVMAVHLARQGKRVLLLDFDLEAPSLSVALLPRKKQPKFGIVDWFVEDAVGQGDSVLRSMVATSSLAQDLPGEVFVVPTCGQEPGDYLAKLGRVQLGLLSAAQHTEPERWTGRLLRLLRALERDYQPDITILDSHSGFHDITAALVTDVRSLVLLFASGSEQSLSGYEILFRHWLDHGVAVAIRERIKMVSAMVPELNSQEHIASVREAAWNLFCDHIYDQAGISENDEVFSFNLNDVGGPHNPLPIYWNRDLVSFKSLRSLKESSLWAAYGRFLYELDRIPSLANCRSPS